MKLFQKLIVAPATLGFLIPSAAFAEEIKFTELSNYSSSKEVKSISEFDPAKELAVTNSRIDGLESRFNNFEAGSFSETTTASFKVMGAIGAVDGKGISTGVTDGDEDIHAQYSFGMKLNTSFTGEDSLEIAIDAGNADSATPTDEFASMNNTVDIMTIDGVSYTFPIGDSITAYVGDNTDGSNLFTTACAYGGPSDTLDDCGNVNAAFATGGVSTGASYDFGNGLTFAVGYEGGENSGGTTTGLATKESIDGIGANLAYIADNYGVSLTYASIESGTNGVDTDTYTALNGYYSFDNGMSISAGYEVGSLGGEVAASDETLAYFVGVSGEVGPGELGAALGTTGSMTEASSTITEEMMYEAYYSFPLNDGMTITPLVYLQEKATAGTPDQTGVMVRTTFKF